MKKTATIFNSVITTKFLKVRSNIAIFNIKVKVFCLYLFFGLTFGMSLDVNACNFYCSNCSDCIEKINSALPGQTICLNANISNHKGTCINNPLNFNNKIFDCQKNTIDGDDNGTDYGIYLSGKFGNIIKNCIVTGFHYGIYLSHSSNNTLTNNIVNDNQDSGIFLWYSSNNTLTNNTLNNNPYNFNIYGGEISHYYQNIDTSNTINGKPIYYWTNEKNAPTPNACKNAEINETHNAGFVALVSCNNITVKNLDLASNSHGILLVNTSNSKLLNNTANNNLCGISLHHSSNNILTNNAANNNIRKVQDTGSGLLIWCGLGISLLESSNNTITNNTANNNYYDGIFLLNSSNNILNNNIMSNNYRGIMLASSSNNILNNNTISNNSEGIWLVSSSNNNITDNTANNNTNGIYLRNSLKNNLTNNMANNNTNGVYLESSSNNTLISNTANNNTNGIYIFYNSNFNIISDNIVMNNKENGVAITNCVSGWCVEGNIDNIIHANKILNNAIGIFSQNSSSIINNNVVCSNTKLDFNSSNWLLSFGDNNTCDKPNGWNDTSVKNAGNTGCKFSCSQLICTEFDFDNNSKIDIFDVVAGLEHLSYGKTVYNTHCSGGSDNKIDLSDIFRLIYILVNL